jgi:hypothetical protein
VVSLWAGGVAIAAIWYGKEVGLTNNVGMYLSDWGRLMGQYNY